MAGRRANNILDLEMYSFVFSVLVHKLRAYSSSSLGQGGGKGAGQSVGPDRGYAGQWKWFVSFLVCVVLLPPDLIHELSCKPGQDASFAHLRPDGGYHGVCMLSAVSAQVQVHHSTLHFSPL